MSWYNAASRRIQLICISLAVTVLVSGCQVRPLYSDGGATAQALGSIEFSDAGDRVEQEVRNRLIFLTSGGAGEPEQPEYLMALNVTSQVLGVLFNQSTDTAGAGRVLIKADYNLTRLSTGETIRSGNRTAVALVDFPVQEFAKLRAIREGENRAARELAEIIRADIAAALRK